MKHGFNVADDQIFPKSDIQNILDMQNHTEWSSLNDMDRRMYHPGFFVTVLYAVFPVLLLATIKY